MKNLMIAVMGIAACVASPAFAQSTGTVTIDGSVAPRCLFTTPSASIELNEMALSGTGTTAGKLNTAVVNGKTRTLVGWCNGSASTMSVEAQALTLTGSAGTIPTGFDTTVNYTATAVAKGVSATHTSTDEDAGDEETVGLFTGNVVVTLSSASTPTSGLLVAGDYNGQVLVNLSAAIALPPVTSE